MTSYRDVLYPATMLELYLHVQAGSAAAYQAKLATTDPHQYGWLAELTPERAMDSLFGAWFRRHIADPAGYVRALADAVQARDCLDCVFIRLNALCVVPRGFDEIRIVRTLRDAAGRRVGERTTSHTAGEQPLAPITRSHILARLRAAGFDAVDDMETAFARLSKLMTTYDAEQNIIARLLYLALIQVAVHRQSGLVDTFLDQAGTALTYQPRQLPLLK